MISVFLVNDSPIGIRNPSSVKVSINGISSEAARTDSGEIRTLNKVNSIPKLVVSWDLLTVEEFETLCSLLGIDVAEFGSTYQVKTIEALAYKITTRLPMGVKSFMAYVGETVEGTLEDFGDLDRTGEDRFISNAEPGVNVANSSNIGGQYWRDVSISLIGLGEAYNA